MSPRSCLGGSADWSGGRCRADIWKPDPGRAFLVFHHPKRRQQSPLVGDVLAQVCRKARAVGEIIARLERGPDDALERLALLCRDAGGFEAFLDVGWAALRREHNVD